MSAPQSTPGSARDAATGRATDHALPNRARDDRDLLLTFLRNHDAACPDCGYNLRALTQPVCPECGQGLFLTVGAARLRLGWLLAALAPGFFSGIAAVFVFGLIVIHLVVLGSTWKIIAFVDTFGWISGLAAILLARQRTPFLALSRPTQRWWAAGIWFTHVAVLIGFILLGRYLG